MVSQAEIDRTAVICTRCRAPKTLDEFGQDKGRSSGISGQCRTCRAADERARRAANPVQNRERGRRADRAQNARRRTAAFSYLGGRCVDCGTADPAVLEFHHARGVKAFTISRALGRPWTVIVAELDKCDLLCANCHLRRAKD